MKVREENWLIDHLSRRLVASLDTLFSNKSKEKTRKGTGEKIRNMFTCQYLISKDHGTPI